MLRTNRSDGPVTWTQTALRSAPFQPKRPRNRIGEQHRRIRVSPTCRRHRHVPAEGTVRLKEQYHESSTDSERARAGTRDAPLTRSLDTPERATRLSHREPPPQEVPVIAAAVYARRSTEQTGDADAKSVARQIENVRGFHPRSSQWKYPCRLLARDRGLIQAISGDCPAGQLLRFKPLQSDATPWRMQRNSQRRFR